MTSAHDESGDDTTSSLGDSTYDFIDDRSNVTTDDEDQDAMTASITSSDGHTFEQVHPPPQGAGLGNPVDQNSCDAANLHRHDHQDSSGSGPFLSSQFADLPEVHASRPQNDCEPIEFDEPSITNLNCSRFTEVSHTLKIVENHEHPNVYYSNLLDRFKGHLAVTVRQTMTSHNLSPDDGQYKVMYIGDTAAREPIIQKIGAALASTLNCYGHDSKTMRPSKFNIIPISAFGEKSSPDIVLIDSSGLELTVEDCSHASFAKKEGGNDSLCLELSNGTVIRSSWNGSNFTIFDDWNLPDIAIFCMSDNESHASKMTRQIARSFMSRHKILSIVISQSSTWDRPPTEALTLDYQTPHICVESRKSSLVHAQMIRRFPIDITTFLNIDCGQMNRNLACLTAASKSSVKRQNDKALGVEKSPHTVANHSWSPQAVFKSLVSNVQESGLKELAWYEFTAGLAIMLMSLLGMMILGFGLTELLGASRVSTSRVFPTQAYRIPASKFSAATSVAVLTVPLSLPSSSPLIASSSSSVSSQYSPAKSPAWDTDLASLFLDAYTLAPNKSEEFKVHVLGDSHIILRPPHWFSKTKRSPKLLFKVVRAGREIHHQSTTLFDGVYALQVPREDNYGILNVEIWTESKPIINEKFEVDFGSSWFKVAGWMKATQVLTESIRGDLNSVQTGLGTVYNHTRAGLLTFLRQQRAKIAAQASAETGVIVSRFQAVTQTKELFVARAKGLQHLFFEGLYDTGVTASSHIINGVDGLTKGLALFARNKTSIISRHQNYLTRATTVTDVGTLFNGIDSFRRRHLRETQKRALRAWWTLKGVPKQRELHSKANDRSSDGCEL